MTKYEKEIGIYLTDKIKFIRKSDPEFKSDLTCPHIQRMDKIGQSKEQNLYEYLEKHKRDVIYFLLNEDSVFHLFYKENDIEYYCIRSRHINQQNG